jgi:peptidoglycan/LPS O-acetylase OafA/YrhL
MHSRQTLIDALKLVGAQLIVLHHFAAYGPLADAVGNIAPGLIAWLFDYARMAVQVFLVLGGFLAVQSLASTQFSSAASWLGSLRRRYQRLVLPFLVALLLAMASAALARLWLSDEFIPAAPRLSQVLAHLFLLHGVLEVDALSAGVWYVAIDFQLFVLLTLLLWLGYRLSQIMRITKWLVVVLMLASLFYFNRHESHDNWAWYFFGAYGMGATAYWASQSKHVKLQLACLAGVGALALALDFRLRIALALCVALLLGLSQWQQRTQLSSDDPDTLIKRIVQRLGQSSYALFLLHFPVLMLGNALFAGTALYSPQSAMAVVLLCWLASVGLALLFERYVEAPLARWGNLSSKGSTSAAAARPVQSTSPRIR